MNTRATLAAEGLPRRAFTVAELARMMEIGLVADHERLELVGGELVPMSSKGLRHELVKAALLERWIPGARGLGLRIVPNTPWELATDALFEPDLVVFDRAVGLEALAPETALLVVELADSSLGYDLGMKAQIYAGFAVPELWVIDVRRLVVHVHRMPDAEGYGSIIALGSEDVVVPERVPELALRLSDLEIGW